MANISPGNYTVREILSLAGFDLATKAKSDNGDDVDRRRVRIGGLPFDNEDKVIHVPVTTDELVISLDGKADTVLAVKLSDEHRAEREYSFMTAAEADKPATKTKLGDRTMPAPDDEHADGPQGETFQFDRTRFG
jgi:hypothetical protein